MKIKLPFIRRSKVQRELDDLWAIVVKREHEAREEEAKDEKYKMSSATRQAGYATGLLTAHNRITNKLGCEIRELPEIV